MQKNRVDNKGVFFICAVGLNGGSLLNPILYRWKIEEVGKATRDTIRQVLVMFFELALVGQYGEKIKSYLPMFKDKGFKRKVCLKLKTVRTYFNLSVPHVSIAIR